MTATIFDLHKAEAELSEAKRDLSEAIERRDLLDEHIKAMDRVLEWGQRPTVLERNDCSRVHKLAEAFRAGKALELHGKGALSEEDGRLLFDGCQSFVVSNDWAGAIGNAIEEAQGDIKLPFPMCCFEFRISGVAVLVWIGQHPDIDGYAGLRSTPWIDAGDGYWISNGKTAAEELPMQFIWEQIRAICVALDAEVATREVVRAPHALNVKRAKSQKPLMADYHVVSLAKRYRVSAGAGQTTGRHPRLHFRRGHWRHYEGHKTWIKWMLVGDPDLGFIAKHYAL